MGLNPICLVFLYKEGETPEGPAHRGKARRGHSEKRPSASQGAKPQEKPKLPTAWSWTPSLQDCEKIKFYCLSHSVLNNKLKPEELDIRR